MWSFWLLVESGDSFFDSEVLRLVAKASEGDPKVEFFYGDVAKPTSRSGFELYPERLTRRFLFSRTVCHQAWFVRRSVYESLGGYETNLPSGGDPRFLLRMVLLHQITHRGIRKVVVEYQGGGVSQKTENIQKARTWVAQLKREIYGPISYCFWSVAVNAKNYLKRLVYDPFAWRLVRWNRNRKVK